MPELTSTSVSPCAVAFPRTPPCPNMSSPKGVQRSYLRYGNCAPKRTSYSRVFTSNGSVSGQNLPQVGNGAGTFLGILEVPKNSRTSTTNPNQVAAFKPKEAFHPFSPAQCPALKKPVCP